jgi:polysaccharide chain length determinant protein (PEP-CTERM system associated)
MNTDQGFQLNDLGQIVRRRLPIIVGVAGAIFLTALMVACWLPNRYETHATLLVEPQVISEKLIETGLAKSDLNARLHLMTMQILSRSRLSKVIDDLKLYPEESEYMTREQIIELMRSMIRVEPVLPELEQQSQILQRRSSNGEIEINTFRLFFLSDSPGTAAAVANRLANDFIDEHIKERVQVSGDTSEFIEAELARLAARIQEVEARIAEVKSQNPGRLPEDMDANQRLLERAFDQLRVAQRDLAEAESDQAFYKQAVLTSAQSPGGSETSDPAQKLERLRLDIATLRARGYTDKHPDIVATQVEIQQLEARLGAEAGSQKPTFSAAEQNAEAERRRASLRIESAQQEIARINATIDEVTNKLADTPRVTEQLSALEREFEYLSKNVIDYSNKRLEAGVAANMERKQKGEQFRVLESAFPPPDPVSPNRVIIVLVGMMLGLAVGAGLGILLESADSSFHGSNDLQSALRIPVLAQIPAILLDADRVTKRRRQLKIAAATTAVVGLALVFSGTGYIYRNGMPSFLAGPPTPEAAPPAPGAAPAPPPQPAPPAAAAPDAAPQG